MLSLSGLSGYNLPTATSSTLPKVATRKRAANKADHFPAVMRIDLFHNYKAYKSSVNVKNKNKITARCLLAELLRQFRCRFLRPLIASHVRVITQTRPLNPKPKQPDISIATEKHTVIELDLSLLSRGSGARLCGFTGRSSRSACSRRSLGQRLVSLRRRKQILHESKRQHNCGQTESDYP